MASRYMRRRKVVLLEDSDEEALRISPPETEEEGSELDEGGSGEWDNELASEDRPRKKAKTSVSKGGETRIEGGVATTSATAVQPRKTRRDLSALLTLPLDVLFEIFGHLHPKDTLALLSVNKAFHESLSAPRATSVWKACRERAGVPPPPSWVSERAWAGALFRNLCESCGAKNVPAVDFSLLKRVCMACRKAHLVVESQVKKRFSRVDKEMLDLLLYTHTSGSSRGFRSQRVSRYFWDQDVENLVAKLRAFERAVKEEGAAAKWRLDGFLDERRKRVREVKSKAPGYQSWLKDYTAERQKIAQELQEKRKEAIVERFVSLGLGYKEEDVEQAENLPAFQSTAPLTETAWKRIRPTLEPKIIEAQKERLEREYARIKRSRKHIAERLYERYKAALTPMEWAYLPGSVDVCGLEPFARVIHEKAEVNVGVEEFEEAMRLLPGLVEGMLEKRKRKLRKLVLRGTTPAAAKTIKAQDQAGGVDVLEMATSTFLCSNQRFGGHARPFVVIGLDELMRHHCSDLRVPAPPYRDRPSKKAAIDDLAFSQHASSLAGPLIRLAGLDPESALVLEMDGKDLRFDCAACEARYDAAAGGWVRVGYTWRDAIVHALREPHPKLSAPSEYTWTVLSEADADTVKAHERTDPKWDRPHWTCGRCSAYLLNLREHSVILEHLKTEHDIPNPQEPVDLFLFELFRSPFVRQTTYRVPQPYPLLEQLKIMTAKSAGGTLKFACLRCQSADGPHELQVMEDLKGYDCDGIIQHLQIEHGVDEPQFGTDLCEETWQKSSGLRK